MRSSHRATALSVVLVVAAVACGVPTGDDTFTAVPAAEVPFGLAETTTTTTTPPTTTTAATPTTDVTQTIAPTTTTPIRLDPVDIYFLTRGRLQPVVREIPTGFSADQIADILEEGPPPDLALESLIVDGLIAGSFESRGVLTVDLDADAFSGIPTTQQTEAIAQIVLTMVSSLRRVGLVNFTIDGESISVKKGNSLLSEVGEPLSYEDYVQLLVNPPTADTPDTTDVTQTTDADDGANVDDEPSDSVVDATAGSESAG